MCNILRSYSFVVEATFKKLRHIIVEIDYMKKPVSLLGWSMYKGKPQPGITGNFNISGEKRNLSR